MSRYSDLHDLRLQTWPLCNGKNKRALPESVTTENQKHEPVRMHNLLLNEFRCPICKRKSHGTMFEKRCRYDP